MAFPSLVAQAMTQIASKIWKHKNKREGTFTAFEGYLLSDEEEKEEDNDTHNLNDVLYNDTLGDDEDDTDIGGGGLQLMPGSYPDYVDLYEAVNEDLWQNWRAAFGLDPSMRVEAFCTRKSLKKTKNLLWPWPNFHHLTLC